MAPGSIASVGECMLELSPDGQGGWRMGHAGDTFNTLWALHALLPRSGADYVTAFGDDPFSQGQQDFFREAGIGTAASPVITGARPGLYAITLNGAERSFTYWRSDAAARRLADDREALRRSLAGRALIYFSGITLAILDEVPRATLLESVAEARRAGALVAFDPNYRPRLWPDREAARSAISHALAVTDIALPTFPDEQDFFGDADAQATIMRLRDSGVGEAAIKDGDRPAVLAWHGGTAEVPAVTVEAVDTTGAGDAFNGGYLAARLAGDDPVAAARKAHRVAAATVQVRGALADPELLRRAWSQTATP